MPSVGLDQSQTEDMDLVEELFEPFVFGDPCLHLGEQILGDVDGTGLVAGSLEGEVLASVEGSAVVASAGGASTAVGVSVEGSGQDGGGSGQLLEPALEHATDQGGVVRNAHGEAEDKGRATGVDRLSGKRVKRPGGNKRGGGRDTERDGNSLLARSESAPQGAS
jgi:hypothetical protein